MKYLIFLLLAGCDNVGFSKLLEAAKENPEMGVHFPVTSPERHRGKYVLHYVGPLDE